MKKSVLCLFLIMLMIPCAIFARGAKETTANDKLIRIFSIENDGDGYYTLIGEEQDGVTLLYHITPETKSNCAISNYKAGDIVLIQDNGMITMSIPGQTTALQIRNMSWAVSSGMLTTSFKPFELHFATINMDDLFSKFSYSYGYLIMQKLAGDGLVVNGGYFARGLFDAFANNTDALFFSQSEMNNYINDYVAEYYQLGIPGEAGEVCVTADQINSLPAPETLPEKFAYSYGFLTTTSLLSNGYDLIAPDYVQGILSYLYSFEPIMSLEDMDSVLGDYIAYQNEKYEAWRSETAAQNATIAEIVLQDNANNPNVTTLPSGVQIEVINEAETLGETPTKEDTVIVNYTLKLPDGSEIDQGNEAYFPLTSVIPGFADAVTNMKVGQTILAYIPPELGYGENGNNAVPPSSLLMFTIELVDIVK